MAVILRNLPYIILLLGISYLVWLVFSTKVLPKINTREKAIVAKREAGAKALLDAKKVMKDWLEYEINPDKAFDAPTMLDVRVPEVSRLTKEINAFNSKWSGFMEQSEHPEISDDFIVDANRLKETFDAAENKSKELDGWK